MYGRDREARRHEALKVLVPLFDRETRERNAGVADILAAEVAKATADVDGQAAMAGIDSVYLCP